MINILSVERNYGKKFKTISTVRPQRLENYLPDAAAKAHCLAPTTGKLFTRRSTKQTFVAMTTKHCAKHSLTTYN
jgi:hypothetical protein